MTDEVAREVADWWRTRIIEMEPGVIRLRGHDVQDLIGAVTFPEMIWLMLRGTMPGQGEARLLEAALVAAVDHGPQAPSIAAARMAMTCGVSINNAMASALNMLGDVHGGAGEACTALLYRIDERERGRAVADALADWREEHGPFVPGFGHRFHKPTDPRAPALLAQVDAAAMVGTVTGRFAAHARTVEALLSSGRPAAVPMNIDGATAVIFAELGFPSPLARGLFCLSRAVGILAHAYEQSAQGGRNKGPTPPRFRWTYDGED